MKKPTKPNLVRKSKAEIANFYRTWGAKQVWPCVECRGHGKIYDPEDPPCPIEGNKGRHKIRCPKCDGTGEGQESDYSKLLKEAKEKHKIAVANYNKDLGLYNSIMKKLTDEELKYIERNK